MGRIIPYIMENKKCPKPPTSDVVEYDAIFRICSALEMVSQVSQSQWRSSPVSFDSSAVLPH
jgi:hypothetical protein